MATSWSSTTAASVLDALGNGGSFTISQVWIKLHVGSPGSAGTSNPATETTRKQASFANASGGSMATDAALSWTSVAGSEDYTHFSAWTASTAGTFLFSGTITASAVTAGGNFDISSGGLTVSLTVAS